MTKRVTPADINNILDGLITPEEHEQTLPGDAHQTTEGQHQGGSNEQNDRDGRGHWALNFN